MDLYNCYSTRGIHRFCGRQRTAWLDGGEPTAVLQAVLLDGHLLGQLRQRLVDGVAASQGLRETPLKALHLLHGALGKGRPAEHTHTHLRER